MPRSMWSGSLSFGLVNVPIKMVSAVSHKEVRFHLLHDADGARIQFKRVCSADGQEVPYEHIVKGFEIERDRYVTTTPEELSKFAPKITRTIEIEDFVNPAEIDPIYYEETYYLLPDKGADKSYALLAQAIASKRKVGIARMVLRSKQYLCCIRPTGNALALSTLLYPDEILSIDKLEGIPAREKLPPRELKLAEQLVESLSAKFEPRKYKDEYRQLVLDFLEKKAEGHTVQPVESARTAKVVNLRDALAASLAAARGKKRAAAATTKRAPVRAIRAGRRAIEPARKSA